MAVNEVEIGAGNTLKLDKLNTVDEFRKALNVSSFIRLLNWVFFSLGEIIIETMYYQTACSLFEYNE